MTDKLYQGIAVAKEANDVFPVYYSPNQLLDFLDADAEEQLNDVKGRVCTVIGPQVLSAMWLARPVSLEKIKGIAEGLVVKHKGG